MRCAFSSSASRAPSARTPSARGTGSPASPLQGSAPRPAPDPAQPRTPRRTVSSRATPRGCSRRTARGPSSPPRCRSRCSARRGCCLPYSPRRCPCTERAPGPRETEPPPRSFRDQPGLRRGRLATFGRRRVRGGAPGHVARARASARKTRRLRRPGGGTRESSSRVDGRARSGGSGSDRLTFLSPSSCPAFVDKRHLAQSRARETQSLRFVGDDDSREGRRVARRSVEVDARERLPVGLYDVHVRGRGRSPRGASVNARERLPVGREDVRVRGGGRPPRGASADARTDSVEHRTRALAARGHLEVLQWARENGCSV